MNRLTCLAVALSLSGSACFTTKIRSGVAEPTLVTHKKKQWFLINGAIPLSRKAGAECPVGVSYAESKVNGTDILLKVALTAAGFAVSVAGCYTPLDPSCATLLSSPSVIPLLVGSRTVRYQCASGERRSPPPTRVQ